MTVLTNLTRLNLGCGDQPLPGYVNTDIRPGVGDATFDARDIPMPDESVDELVAHDLLEHFPSSQTSGVLGEWRRVLRVRGKLVIRVPNLLALSQSIVDGEFPPEMIRNIYGGHRWGKDGELDCHHTGWTPDLIAELLHRHGFDVVSNDRELNMTVEAVRR